MGLWEVENPAPTHPALSSPRKQVLATKAEAEKDGVKVPTTLAEYCIKTKVPSNDNSSDLLYDDLYDDDIDDEDEEEEDADCYDDDDSGNEESWPAPSVPLYCPANSGQKGAAVT